MKRLFSLIAVAVLVLGAFSAKAQVPTYSVQSISLSSIFPWGNGKSNVNAIVDCRKQASVGFQLLTAGHSGSTLTMGISRSADGSYFSATEEEVIPLGANAAAGSPTAPKACEFTNVLSKGAGYIKVLWVSNNAANNLTNGTVLKYGIKISSP